MNMINLNNTEEYIKEISIFNDGKAGIVEGVTLKIVRKSPSDKENAPDYKLIASDDKGEVNEGFYYQKPNEKGEFPGFKSYQAQKLINLAKGVLGQNVVFPKFQTPSETLDGVMEMVAPALNKKLFNVAVTYGTTKNPREFLQFKSFGEFVELAGKECTLSLNANDSVIRGEPKASSTSTVEEKVIGSKEAADIFGVDS